MASRRTWGVFAVVLSLAGGLPAFVRLPPRGVRGWVQRELAARAAIEHARWLEAQVPPQPGPRGSEIIVEADDDRARVIAHTMRIEIARGLPTYARDRTEQPIIGVALADSRWLFTTTGGQVFRASTFLGPLTLVGGLPCVASRRHPSDGRVVLEDETGALWTTDGNAPLERLRGFEHALTAAFLDPRRGAGIAAGGALYLTDDGGASWRRSQAVGAAVALLHNERGLVAVSEVGEVPVIAAPVRVPRELRSDEVGALERATTELPSLHVPVHAAGTACHSDRARDERRVAALENDPFAAYRRTPPAYAVPHPRHPPRPVPTFDTSWRPPALALRPLGPACEQPEGCRGFEEGAARRAPLGTHGELSAPDEHFAAGPVVFRDSRSGSATITGLYWRGYDGAGRSYQLSRDDFSGRWIAAAFETQHPVTVRLDVAALTPRGALVRFTALNVDSGLRIGHGAEWQRGALVWAGSGGVRRVWAPFVTSERIEGVGRADGGAVVLHVSTTRQSEAMHTRLQNVPRARDPYRYHGQLFTVVELGPDGAVRARRSWAWRAEEVGVLGLYDSADGAAGAALVRSSSDEADRVYAYAVGDGRVEALSVGRPRDDDGGETRAQACRAAEDPARRRLVVLRQSEEQDLGVEMPGGFDAPEYARATRVDYELEDGRWCVRSLEGSGQGFLPLGIDDGDGDGDGDGGRGDAPLSFHPIRVVQGSEPRRYVWLRARRDGTFAGDSDDGRTIHAVRARAADDREPAAPQEDL